MEKQIIWRGLVAGGAAGVLAFVFARIFVEPVVGRAIDYESGRGEVESALTGEHHHEMEIFTRGIQANVGMGFGVLAFSVAMGALFAVVFAVGYPRFSTLPARAVALAMAVSAFVAVYLVPFIKYPANPPAIGEPDTIGKRAGLYLLMIVLSVAFAVGATWLGRALAPRIGAWNSMLAGFGSYLAAVVLVMLVLPTVSETPQPVVTDAGTLVYPGFPADDLFEFRLSALGTQLVIWLTIGLVAGGLFDRLLNPEKREHIAV